MTSLALRSKYNTGVMLVLISALVFSSAGIFTKGVDTDAWGVIFWRGLAAVCFTLGYLIFRGQLRREIAAFGWPALAVTLVMASGTMAFIPAFKLTSVANVALIYAAAPFICAALAWVSIGERPTRIVFIASLAAFGGVCFIVAGSIGGGGAIKGDLLALWMTLMMSATMVIYRRWPQTTAALPAALSSLILLPVALIFGEPLAAPVNELPILCLFGLVFAVASVTLSEGARRLPPAETALLSALETPLGPLLAFFVLLEVPSQSTVLGGVVILLAVFWSQWAGRK